MELHDLAEHHLVSASQAASIGVDPSGLIRLVKVGALRRVIRGWYAVRPPGQQRAPWEGADDFEPGAGHGRVDPLPHEGEVAAAPARMR